MKKFDLEIFDIKNLKTHGGSLRYYVKKRQNKHFKISKTVHKQINKEIIFGLHKFNTYKRFSKNVKKSKKDLLQIFKKIKKNNKSIIGYGATAKAVTVLNYCKINNSLITNFTDVTPEKIDKFMPGQNIKILKYKKDILKKFDFGFLGAWNFKNEILKKEKKYIKRGFKFITHVPKPKILRNLNEFSK